MIPADEIYFLKMKMICFDLESKNAAGMKYKFTYKDLNLSWTEQKYDKDNPILLILKIQTYNTKGFTLSITQENEH